MGIFYYIQRILRLIRLIVIKLRMGRKLYLASDLCKYNISFDTNIRITSNGKMYLDSFNTEKNVYLTARGGTLRVGNNCSFNRNNIIIAHKLIKIGRNTVFGPNICIYDHDHVFNENGKIPNKYNCSSVIIGNNVWVGAGVIILRGTQIGDNCIIGAGCVISGFIPSNSVVTSSVRNLKITPLRSDGF